MNPAVPSSDREEVAAQGESLVRKSLSAMKPRGLSSGPFSSLSDALTWIAFRDALPLNELQAQVAGAPRPDVKPPKERLREFFSRHAGEPEVDGNGYFCDRKSGLERLTWAWHHLRREVDRGAVKVRGRYTATYSGGDAQLADVVELNGSMLATFSQFDIATGGLRRRPQGAPEVLWMRHPISIDREFESFGDDPRAADGYLLVEVGRDGLLISKALQNATRAPAVKLTAPPSVGAILAKAVEMKDRGVGSRDIAKTMRSEDGFAQVSTCYVRELLRGRWPPGRPKRASVKPAKPHLKPASKTRT